MINVQPVTGGSEVHNEREKDFDHVEKELTRLNENYKEKSIKDTLADVKARYTKTTGQKMQSKATPIREAVVLIKPETTMDDLKRLSVKLEERFGMRTFQIHIHRDEGHHKSVNAGHKEWKPNLHAHMVFDWTDLTTGKSLKLNRQDMSEMQDIVSEVLDTERGVSSDRKHLAPVAFKIEREREKLDILELETERYLKEKARLETNLRKNSEEIRSLHDQYQQYKSDMASLEARRDAITHSGDVMIKKGMLGGVDTAKTAESIGFLIEERDALKNQVKNVSQSFADVDKYNRSLINRIEALENNLKEISAQKSRYFEAANKAMESVYLLKIGSRPYSSVEKYVEKHKDSIVIMIEKRNAELKQKMQNAKSPSNPLPGKSKGGPSMG